MTSSIKWLLAASVLLASITGFSRWENFRESRRGAEERLNLAAAMRATDAERALIETRQATAEKRVVELKNGSAAPAQRKAAAGIASASSGSPATKPVRSDSIEHIIRNEPEAQAVYLESQRAALRATYGPLFRELGLAPAEWDIFRSNIMALREKNMDLNYLLLEDGADLASIARLRTIASEEYEAAQRSLLTNEQLGRLKEYERTSPLRTMVNAIAGASVVEGVPIDAQQADQIVQILAQASTSFQRGGTAGLASVQWPAVEPLIRGVLTPAQFEVFRSVDPGPSAGGFAQTMLYAAVNRANEVDKAAKRADSPRPGGKE